MYQKDLTREIAAIKAVLAARLGVPVRITYRFTDSEATIHAHAGSGRQVRSYRLSSPQSRNIDSALRIAMEAAQAIRTIADERADLGLKEPKA